MNLQRLAAAAGILALLAMAFQQARSADPPAEPSSSAKPASDFAIRYAQANLRLAELKLQKAVDMNRRVPRTLANNVIEQFNNDVALAKDQVKAAQQNDSGDVFGLWLQRAEMDLKKREEQLQAATTTNRREAGTYTALDLDRRRAAVELARLRVEHGRSLSNASPEEKLAWQLEMMSEGLNRVDQMISLTLQNRLAEFF
ncbi:MAG: hypothetical protein AB7O59_01850 [Pirellulales bacterium]